MPPFRCIYTLYPSDDARFLIFAHNYRVFFSLEHPELVPLITSRTPTRRTTTSNPQVAPLHTPRARDRVNDEGRTTMNKEKILITAANSHSGFSAAKELLELGFPVRAFVRTPNKQRARELERLGAEIVA